MSLASFKIALLAAGALLCGTAQAVDLVNNGGFETGNLDGWLLQMGSPSVSGPAEVHSGAFALAQGSGLAYFTQFLSTTVGTSYEVSAWVKNIATSSTDSPHNLLRLDFGPTVALELRNLPYPSIYDPFVHYTARVTATSEQTLLAITMGNTDGFWRLDDVSVTAAVPEPATASTLLLGLGLMGAAAARARRRSAPAT